MRAKEFTFEAKARTRELGGFTVVPVAKIGDAEVDEAIGLNAPHRSLGKGRDDEIGQFVDRTKTGTKTKKDRATMPYIHASNIKITKDEDGNDTWDLKDLASQVTTRPASIIGANGKMKKSTTAEELIVDLTLPALKGLVVDEETGEFVEIQTCPNAGACQQYCYARQGNYIIFPASSMSAARSLNFLVNDPDGWFDLLRGELYVMRTKSKASGYSKLVVRWHDAGDFFSKEYLDKAFAIAREFPNVGFYAYTKSADAATSPDMPPNFKINFSTGAERSQEKKIELHKSQGNTVKQAEVVPAEMFDDLVAREGRKLIKDAQGRTQFKDEQSFEVFKQRLAQAYKVDPNSIITYDQMMAMPEGPQPKWNVVVQAGAGDRAANRLDVINSFLMWHK